MDRFHVQVGGSVSARLAIAATIVLITCFASGFPQVAQAQFQAGSFVDGQPVFASNRSRGAIMRLRGRRSGVRQARKRWRKRARQDRQARRRAVDKLPTVGQSRARGRLVGVATNDQRDFQLPPLPPQAAAVSSNVKTSSLAADLLRVARERRRLRKAKNGKVMQIVVSLGRQRMTVYEDGRPVRQSGVSSGKAGHNTPTGVFSIIQQRRHHRSNIYNGASMPFMQRITWSGIALHQGRLPGYAASHGCIRLPGRFARQLFKSTQMRTHIVIAAGNPVPRAISHRNLLGPSDLEQQELAVLVPSTTNLVTGALPRRRVASLLVPVRYDVWDVSVRSAVEKAPMGYDTDVHQLTAMLHRDQTDQLAHRHRVKRTRRSGPLRVLVTRRNQRDRTRDVQRQFVMLGYDVGGVDGQIGRQMIAATKAFQLANNLRATGLPDAATRDLLDIRTKQSRPAEGTVYVRQNGRQIYSGPISIAHSSEPLGTHLYTLADLGDAPETREWLAVTAQAKGRLPSWSKKRWKKQLAEIKAVSAHEAISRIAFPKHVRQSIEDRLTPGSSLIIADLGSERETRLATDFIVLTD